MRHELLQIRKEETLSMNCPNGNLEALLLLLNPVLTMNPSLLLDKSSLLNQSSLLKYVQICKLEVENKIFKDLAILLGEE